MNHEQLLAHYSLMGWVAWLEVGDRYNISRPGAGTYWAWPDLEETGHNPTDMYAIVTAFDRVIELHEIPETVFLRLMSRVKGEGHDT